MPARRNQSNVRAASLKLSPTCDRPSREGRPDADVDESAAVAAQASPEIRGPGYIEWARRLAADLNHFRHAIQAFMALGRPEAVVQIGVDLQVFFMNNGLQVEFVAVIVAAIDETPETDPLRIQGWWSAAMMSAEITDPLGVDQARAGLAEAHVTGDPSLIGRMELAPGAAIRHTSIDPEYLSHVTEGRRLLEAHPAPYWWDPTWERGLFQLIIAAYLPQTDDRLREHFDEAIRALGESGDPVLHAATLGETAAL